MIKLLMMLFIVKLNARNNISEHIYIYFYHLHDYCVTAKTFSWCNTIYA